MRGCGVRDYDTALAVAKRAIAHLAKVRLLLTLDEAASDNVAAAQDLSRVPLQSLTHHNRPFIRSQLASTLGPKKVTGKVRALPTLDEAASDNVAAAQISRGYLNPNLQDVYHRS